MTDIERRHMLAGLASSAVLAPAATATAQPVPAGRFAGKAVIVTGGTSGIGRATVEAFAAAGAHVAFNGRREALGREVEALVRAAGGEAAYIRSDVRVADDMQRFVAAAVERHGGLDIAFNNAGVDYPPAPIADTTTESFDDLVATNLRGVFLAMKYELPHLVRSRGAVINMASIGGRHAFPNIAGYSVSKAGVIHLTRTAAQEYGKSVRINAIAPGAIETPMLERVRRDWKVTTEQLVAHYPMQRAGTPAEIAAVVMWLASPEASYVSGQVLGIDGGDLP